MSLAGWEVDCCQHLPEVGDPVGRPLEWHDLPDAPGAFDIRWSTRAVTLSRDDARVVGVDAGLVLGRGGLRAWWPAPAADPVPRRGLLVVQAHVGVPSIVPDTRGRATGVEGVDGGWLVGIDVVH
ncbi:hypothetical protein [Geodermatophilus sp. DSM 45219]|uniref:hypothetical protein n=1 Tax=Geodermatophilus sp. DSM 45219 TaxID=1881103 RepID=UPI0015A2FB46|nr:hypothetical protein [Geodermatophilus sp. DSM 45219]